MGQSCKYIQYVTLIPIYPLPLLPLTGSYKLECLHPPWAPLSCKRDTAQNGRGCGCANGGLGSEARLPNSHISPAQELGDLPWTNNLTALTQFPHRENRLTVPTSRIFCEEYYKTTGFKTLNGTRYYPQTLGQGGQLLFHSCILTVQYGDLRTPSSSREHGMGEEGQTGRQLARTTVVLLETEGAKNRPRKS